MFKAIGHRKGAAMWCRVSGGMELVICPNPYKRYKSMSIFKGYLVMWVREKGEENLFDTVHIQ